MSSIALEYQTGEGSLAIGPRLRRLYARRETIRYLVVSSLKAGHRDKLLGNLWNLLDPLLFMGVYYLVFGVLLGQAGNDPRSFLLHLIVGVLGWRFFDASVGQATNCVRGYRGLIHEINFPKAVFPIAVVISRVYDFLWGLVVLFVVLLIIRQPLTIHILWVLPLLVGQVVFTLGLGFLFAYLGAFYADTANVVTAGMRLWFYGSPIFYYVHARVPEWFRPYYMLNPLACYLESYRAGLVRASMPDVTLMLYAGGISLAMLIFGFAIFSRGEGRFAKYI